MASNGSMRNVGGSAGGLKFGLIKRTGVVSGSNQQIATKKPAVFNNDSDEDALNASDSESPQIKNSKSKPTSSSFRSKAAREIQTQSAPNARVEKAKQAALDEDPNIFDYDGAYDSMKEQEEAQRRKRDLGDVDKHGRKKPRYVSNLLAASLQRKIELERVEDRKVAKERVEEGDLYGDKDAFVTEAYKERQKELRRLEEEERRNEALQKTGGDMAQFYRSLLDSHEQITAGSNLSAKDIAAATAERERREKERASEEKERLEAAINRGEAKINASNEVVDKRVLLKGGLNVSRTKLRVIDEEREADERDRERIREEERQKEREERERKRVEIEKRRAKEEQAKRLLEETEKQMAESEEKRLQKIAREREDLLQKMVKKSTEAVVLDARARYLARKKAQEQQKGEADSD
ncbi:hypothetical protein HK100_002256 [Physocladia obscura]|uniref:Nuclear speckle splicing regulatory protein 1 N-terminal domain-containing protein n=1 Tax=Physocladia obscura TaxID=109957 RepID=A0AAD5T7C0_9FUNG|nr:hypothetical protein HK100_002256 [Physocladia obscura]